MIPTSSKECKFQGADVALVFFTPILKVFRELGTFCLEKNLHTVGLRYVRWSPPRRLLQLTDNYFQASLYMVRISWLFHYRYIVMHTTKDMHLKEEHWRLRCNLPKGRLTAVAFAPPIGFTYHTFCVSWLWHEYLHHPLNPRNVGVMAPESMEFKYESW